MSKRNLKQRFFLPTDLWARELGQSLIEECGLLMRIAATSRYAGYIVFYPTTIRASHSLRTRTLVVNSFQNRERLRPHENPDSDATALRRRVSRSQLLKIIAETRKMPRP